MTMAKKKNGHSKVKTGDLRKLPKDKRPKPKTGQSAPERELPWDSLSEGEQEIVRALNGKGEGPRHPRSIEFLADLFSGASAKLQVRNSLRRIVACGWVDHADRGTYQISERGRKRRARA
jgi:hypothetical protein